MTPETSPAQAPPPQAPLWTIGWNDGSPPQELETIYPAAGDPFDQWTVRYTTRSGVQAFAQIPAHQYNASHVASVITPAARHIEEVSRLTGPDTPGA